MKPLAPYIRVSTKRQARGHSLDAQENALRRYYAAKGWPFPSSSDLYVDQDSGRKDTREAFNRMLGDIRAGKWGGFCVHTWDRFFRDLFKSLVVYNELKALGITALATDDDYDIFSFDGEERFKQDMLAAEGYSRRISKHIRKGKQQKAESGDTNARRILFGWRREPDGTIVQTTDAAIVDRAARLYLTGAYSCGQVAALVSTPERHFAGWQIQDWLSNPWIAGKITYHPTYFGRGVSARVRRQHVIDGHHPGVVTWAEYERLQEILHERARGGRGVHTRARVYVYGRKLCTCSHCGRALVGRPIRDERRYGCGARLYGRTCEATARTMTEAQMDAQMDLIIAAIVVPEAWIAEVLPRAVELAAPEAQHDAERADLERERQQAIADMAADRITPKEFTRRLADIKKRLAGLSTTRQAVAAGRVQALADALRDLPRLWAVGEPEDRAQLLRGLFTALSVDVVTKRIVSVTAIDDETAAILRGCRGLRELTVGVFALATGT